MSVEREEMNGSKTYYVVCGGSEDFMIKVGGVAILLGQRMFAPNKYDNVTWSKPVEELTAKESNPRDRPSWQRHKQHPRRVHK